MFCPNCGYKVKNIGKARLEEQASLSSDFDSNKQIKVAYQCPTCGKIIHDKLSQEEMKSLNQVAHGKIHKARYDINSGLCSLVIGIILAAIGLMFFALSFDLQKNHTLDTTRVEFIVFCVLISVGLILAIFGSYLLIRGVIAKNAYQNVVKDIQNNTFVQESCVK